MSGPYGHKSPIGRALLVVDVQNDFCEGGALAVVGGADVAARISRYLDDHGDRYETLASTRDWHVEPGRHFASAMGKNAAPDFKDSWPDHCVAGTEGAEYHPALAGSLGRHIQAEFRKGRYEAAYSGFEGVSGDSRETPLLDWLLERGVESVDIAGIATDFCVRATAVDAFSAGFPSRVLTDLVAGVAEQSSEAALDELRALGISLVESGRA